jgi:Tol biopolymer transport system component
LWVYPMDGVLKPYPLIHSEAEEQEGQFSPDGKWIAYQSNESGRFEVYIQPFAGPDATSRGKWQISTDGGAQVRWRRDGKELFYIALDGQVTAVPIRVSTDGQSIERGTPTPLFQARPSGGVVTAAPLRQQYVVSPDGQRFLVNSTVEDVVSPITVIMNWKPPLR